MGLVIDNPITYAQVQLKGGWNRLIVASIAYTIAIGAFIGVSAQIQPRYRNAVLTNWTYGVTALQVAFLLLFVCARIGAAIRADITGRMLESHRLMPTSAPAGVFGYIAGGAIQGLMIGAGNLLLGAFTTQFAALPIYNWLFANFVLLMFCAFLWMVTTTIAFTMRGAIVAVFGLIFGLLMSQGFLLWLLPGMSVLITPLIKRTIFDLSTGKDDFTWGYLASFAAQVVIGGTCFAAACRKYRRSDVPGFTPQLALLLLTGWVTASIVGYVGYDEFKSVLTRYMGEDNDTWRGRFIASMVSAMILAALPISAAARDAATATRRRRSDPTVPRRLLWAEVIALFSVGVMLMLLVVKPMTVSSVTTGGAAVRIALSLAAYALGLSYLLRIIYRFTERGIFLGATWVFMVILVPLIVDVVRHGLADDYSDPPITRISAFGPLGMLLNLYGDTNANTTPGLITQCGLAALLACLFYATGRRRGSAATSDVPAAALQSAA